MRTGILGGTFNPPHLGHLHAACLAKDALGLDKVLFIPTNIPPHKRLPEDTATAADRCEMVRLLTADAPWARLDTIEVDRGGASYTVDTLEMLAGRYPGADLYLAVGGDMLLSFTHWRRWQEILQRCTLVVESRAPGQDCALRQAARRLTETAGGRVLFAGAVSYPCASSDLRSGKIPRSRWPALLPEPVLRIIEEQGLYRPANAPQPGKEEAP